MGKYRYRVVDVFTTRQFEGNPLAVFPDATGMQESAMRNIARELNLSETVFVLPPPTSPSSVRVRIFTPGRELPFAGHPTVGTSYVLLDEKILTPRDGGIVLEEKIGPVPVRIESGDPPMLWLTTPAISEGRFFDRAACAAALGLSLEEMLDIKPQLLLAGNRFIFIALRDRGAVDRAFIGAEAIQKLRGADDREPSGVFVFTPTTDGAYSRVFVPEFGVAEDPATGSATGPLALYMMRNGLAPSARLVSEQGTKMGRRSELHINIRGEMGRDGIEVGGHTAPVAEGWMNA